MRAGCFKSATNYRASQTTGLTILSASFWWFWPVKDGRPPLVNRLPFSNEKSIGGHSGFKHWNASCTHWKCVNTHTRTLKNVFKQHHYSYFEEAVQLLACRYKIRIDNQYGILEVVGRGQTFGWSVAAHAMFMWSVFTWNVCYVSSLDPSLISVFLWSRLSTAAVSSGCYQQTNSLQTHHRTASG